MPYLYCENPSHEQITGRSNTGFTHSSRGRPPKYCPECREVVKPPPVQKKPTGVSEEEVREITLDTLTDYLEGIMNFEDLDARVDKVRDEIARRVDRSFDERIDAVTIKAETEFALTRSMVDKYVDQVVKDRLPKITVIRTEKGDLNVPITAHEKLSLVMQFLNRKHVFLVGPAGSGKSTIGEQASEMLGKRFGSMSYGPTTSNTKIFGFIDANGQFVKTEFYKCYRCTCGNGGKPSGPPCADDCGGIFLGDELDNGHPGLVTELNQALSNWYCAFAHEMVPRSKNFRYIATGNTFGNGADMKFVGRNMLDKATKNRFAIVFIDYDETMEYNLAIAQNYDGKHEWIIQKWIQYCRDVRQNIFERNLDIIVGPRQTIDGSLLLTDGMSWNDCAEGLIWADVEEDVRREIDVVVDLTPPREPEPEPDIEPDIEPEPDEQNAWFDPDDAGDEPDQPANPFGDIPPPKLKPRNPDDDPFKPRQDW